MDTYYQTNDGQKRIEEDFTLFLQELADLMNRYHYSFKQCQFVKLMDENIQVVEFKGDGEFVYPLVEVPSHLLDTGDENEFS